MKTQLLHIPSMTVVGPGQIWHVAYSMSFILSHADRNA